MKQIFIWFFVSSLMILAGCATSPSGTSRDADIVETKAGPAFLAEQLPSALEQRLADARNSFEQGNNERARSLLAQAKSEFPTFPQADVNLALIDFAEENYQQANEALERALMIRQNYPPALNLLGVIARVNGEFSTAADWYRKATELEPQYANAWLNYGILADLYLQDYALALASFEKYLTLVEKDEKVENWVIDLKRRAPELDQNGGTNSSGQAAPQDDQPEPNAGASLSKFEFEEVFATSSARPLLVRSLGEVWDAV